MMKTRIWAMMLMLSTMIPLSVHAHCEIPCGIYGDEMRMDLMDEHILTIEKSMTMIHELSQAEEPNHNQIVRWIMNKEDHCDALQEIVYQYFLTQRIKPVAADDALYDRYVSQVTLLHGLLVQAMKSKQTIDSTHIETMRELLTAFKSIYLVK